MWAAVSSNSPFVKLINAEDMIGKSEQYKVNFLVKSFDDANKSDNSILVIDDLERIMEFVEIGSRFNNNIY